MKSRHQMPVFPMTVSRPAILERIPTAPARVPVTVLRGRGSPARPRSTHVAGQVCNSAPLVICPEPAHKSGKVVQTNGTTSAFLLESLFLSLFGGVLGLALASLMQLIGVSTMNWQSFAEIAFRFSLTPQIVVQSLSFATFIGPLGGLLPAGRAARL
jgi:hypothetical protein